MITVNSTINLTNQAVPPIIPVVQGDTGRAIAFTLSDFTIPAGATATYYVQKPSGEAVYNSAEISGNTVTVELTAQSIIEVGENNLQVRIILDEAVVTSFDVILMVRPFRGIGAVQSETEMNIFDTAVEQAKEEIEAAAQEAEEYISQAIDDTLTIAGKAADAKAVGDALATGYYPELCAGNLTTTDGTTNRTPYTFRAIPYQSVREQMEIDGVTVAWNEVMSFASNKMPSARNGITFSSVDGSACKMTGTATATASAAGWFNLSTTTLVTNHVYYVSDNKVSGSQSIDNGVYFEGGGFGHVIGTPMIAKSNGSNPALKVSNGNALTDFVWTGFCVDLTAMFGPTIADHIYSLEQSTAGSGVAVVKQFLTKDYYPYCAPTLKSVTGLVSHDTTGANIWGGSALLDSFKAAGINNLSYDDTTLTYGAAQISFKTIIENFPFKENTSYTFIITCKNSNNSAATNLRIWYTDGTYANIAMPSATANLKQTAVFTTNATRTVQRVAGINLSGTITLYYLESGVMEGAHTAADFEPYVKHSYPLDSTLTLRGIMKLDGSTIYADGDVYAPDGTVPRRYGEHVFAGTENLTMLSAQTEGWSVFAYNPSPAAINASDGIWDITDAGDVVPYSSFSTLNLTRRLVTHYGDGIRFALPCTSVADALTDLTGKSLVYRLATQTTETANPYTDPQICAPDGTEEFVVEADADGAEVPVGHTTFYPVDLKGRLEGLPNDFSTLIAPTEETYKATRNYTTGSLFIVKNVLYKATANIANGGTITPGTNCTPTTLAEIISAL